MSTSLLKQYASLVKNVSSFTDGQVEVIQDNLVGEEDSVAVISMVFTPKGGLYRGGKFNFSILTKRNGEAPVVTCRTPIYHPNIDPDGEVCLNLLDDLWNSKNTLEDIVQGILFLFYNPNLEDPLSELISGCETYEYFKRNVRKSLRGETIDYYSFERNLPDDFEEEEDEVEVEEYEVRVEEDEFDCSDFIKKMFTEEEDLDCSDFIQQMFAEDDEDKSIDLICPNPESAEADDVNDVKPVVCDEVHSNLKTESSQGFNHPCFHNSTADRVYSHDRRFSRSLSVHTSAMSRFFKLVISFFDRIRYVFPFRILFWNSLTYRTQTVVR